MAKSRQCTVVIRGKRCSNKAKPNSRSCGSHGKSKAIKSTGTRKVKFVSLDFAVRTFDPDEFHRQPEPEPVTTSDIFKKRLRDAAPFKPFIRTDAKGRLISVNLLPTNKWELANLMATFLQQHTIADLERLTPATFDEEACPDIAWKLIASDYIIPRGAKVKPGVVRYYREVIA
jgi:hypothetical protein